MQAAIARRMALSPAAVPQFSVSVETEAVASLDELMEQNAAAVGAAELRVVGDAGPSRCSVLSGTGPKRQRP